MAVCCFVLGELGVYLSFAGVKVMTLVLAGVISIIYFREFKKCSIAVFIVLMYFLGAVRLYTATGDDILTVLDKDSVSGVSVNATVHDISRAPNGYKIYLGDATVFYEDNTYHIKRKLITKTEGNMLMLGQKVSVTGSLVPLNKGDNPGEFNEYNYYRSRNVDCRLEIDDIDITDSKCWIYRDYLRRLRDRLILRFRAVLDEEDAGILEAIVLGDKADIDKDLKGMYQHAGIAHVIAISGLHIGLIGAMIYKVLRRMKMSIISACVISSFLIISYGILSGMSGSCLRAMIMLIVAYLAKVIGRAYDLLSAMSLAALIALFIAPLSFVDAGFLLSFGAVLGIGAVYPVLSSFAKREGLLGRVIDALILSLSINLIISPVIAYFYYELPLYSTAYNLLVVPLMSLLVPSAMVGLGMTYIDSNLADIAFFPARLILAFNKSVCLLNESLPKSSVLVGKPDMVSIVMYYLTLLLIFALINKRHGVLKDLVYYESDIRFAKQMISKRNEYRLLKRMACRLIIGIVVVNICVMGVFFLRDKNTLVIDILYVGQGDGIILKLPDKRVISIDGGSTSNSGLYEYTYIPYLKSQAIGGIDYSIITHSDQDHISAISELIDNGYDIGTLMLPDISTPDDNYSTLRDKALNAGISVSYLSKGMNINDKDVTLNVLHPPYKYSSEDPNYYSTTILLEYKGFKMLFTGDLGGEGESLLLDSYKSSANDIDILKVGHHGSKTSTSNELLDMFTPEYAVISVGERNRYHHPSREVLSRLDNHGVDYICTKDKGMVRIKVKDSGYKFFTYRDK